MKKYWFIIYSLLILGCQPATTPTIQTNDDETAVEVIRPTTIPLPTTPTALYPTATVNPITPTPTISAPSTATVIPTTLTMPEMSPAGTLSTPLFFVSKTELVQFDGTIMTTLQTETGLIYDLQITDEVLYYLVNERLVRFDLNSGLAETIVEEETAVTDYQLSPTHDAIVYVHNNQLILADAKGQNRQILVAGQPYAGEDEDTHGVGPWRREHALYSPVWSPLGDKIAFVMGGVQLIHRDGSSLRMIQPHIPKPCEDCGSVTPIHLAYPESWSPNGRFLTIQQTLVGVHAEGWATAIADLETDQITFPTFSSGAAHRTIWKPDSSAAYMWSDHDWYDGHPSSLELYNPIAQTVTPIITHRPNWWEFGDPYRWLRYPMLADDGELYFFLSDTPEFPQPPPDFTLMKTNAQFWETGEIRDLTAVSPVTLPINYAKWAPQHNSALLNLDTYKPDGTATTYENWYWFSLTDGTFTPLDLPDQCNFVNWQN